MKVTLRRAIEFHGHLGPYLVLGLLAGEAALKRLGAEKYFGLNVKVWGANKKPKSCLIDGVQLSSGATYGKGNIHKYNGKLIKIVFLNKNNKKKISMQLKKNIARELDSLKGHRDSEVFAKGLYKGKFLNIFNLTPNI